MTPNLEALRDDYQTLLGVAAVAGVNGAGAGAAGAAPTTTLAPAATAEAGAGGAGAAATATAPTTAPAPVTPPEPAPGEPAVRCPDPVRRGWHLDVTVRPGQVVDAARIADRHGFAMDAVTGVDWLAAGQMEVVYDYYHPVSPLHVVVRTRVPREAAVVPTVSEVYPGANWHERETHDFFGIRFDGHPDLTPLLLPEDADYHPLRKDFQSAP